MSRAQPASCWKLIASCAVAISTASKTGNRFTVPLHGFRPGPMRMFARRADNRHVRIVIRNSRAARLQQIHQHVARRFAVVFHICLVGEAEHQNSRRPRKVFFGDASALVVWATTRSRHGAVDFARKFHEARFLSDLPRLPREIKRINRDAMTAEAGAGIKRHEAERLGARGGDDFPNVNVHRGINALEFVDERDVDAAKYIFQQLRRLGRAAVGDRHQIADGAAINFPRRVEAGWRVAADDLGNLRDFAFRVAGIFALRRKREVEIFAGFQT